MKKFLSILSALAVITTVSCSSTGSSSQEQSAGENSSASTAEALTETTLQTLYKETPIKIEHMPETPLTVQKSGDKVHYFFCTLEKELYHVILNSSLEVEKEEFIAQSFSDSYSIYVNEDNSFYVISEETDFEFEYDDSRNITNYNDFLENGEARFILTEYDSSGEKKAENEIIGLDREYQLNSSLLKQLCPYGENKLILSYGNGLALIGTDGTLLDSEHYKYKLIDLGMDKDGSVTATMGVNCDVMDGETLKLPESFYEDKDYDPTKIFSGCAVAGTGDYKRFNKRDDGIYGTKENGDEELVMDFGKSLIASGSIYKFTAYDDGKFISAGYGVNPFCLYERRPDDYTEDRITIDLWEIDCGSGDGVIQLFNKSQDKYLIKVSSLKSEEQLTRAILTDNAPDIIDYSGYDLMSDLINLGALADMNELMDKYDGIKREDIMPNVLSAFDIDGHIYTLPEFFYINLGIANSDYIGQEYTNWEYEDLYRFMDEANDDTFLFADDGGRPLSIFCTNNLSPWIDYKNNICNFNSPEFIKLLEFCKKYDDSHFTDIWELPEEEKIIEQKQIFESLKDNSALIKWIDGVGLEMVIQDVGRGGIKFDNATLLNPPGNKGKGYTYAHQIMSVLSSSDCIEGAWEYVSYLLDEERQCDHATRTGFNWTNKKAFDIALEKSITKGDEPEIGKLGHCFDTTTVEIEYEKTISKEQAERYREFVLNCDQLQYDNRDIDNIIWEEANRFFNDEITAEECAEYIQNRSEIMLSEKS